MQQDILIVFELPSKVHSSIRDNNLCVGPYNLLDSLYASLLLPILYSFDVASGTNTVEAGITIRRHSN